MTEAITLAIVTPIGDMREASMRCRAVIHVRQMRLHRHTRDLLAALGDLQTAFLDSAWRTGVASR